MQKRVGAFKSVDPKGIVWNERYNAEGKKVARKKAKVGDTETILTELPAYECWGCGGQFHAGYNNKYSCRQHKGQWIPSRSDPESQGVWNCCAKESRAEPGCKFSFHKLEHA